MGEAKKPYCSKWGNVGDFAVWVVDGNYIRGKIDEEFTNFGQHFKFNFIPEKEFWIDKEASPDEIGFYVTHLLVENRLMAEGKNYDEALSKADIKERQERKKSEFYARTSALKKISKTKLIDEIHKRLLKEYSGAARVWVIRGELVRDLFYIDFTEGGHDIVYSFVPKNEIWLDDDLSPRERKFVLLHEVCERNLMLQGMNYNSAHAIASSKEHYCRLHPDETLSLLKVEFEKLNTINKK